MSDKSDDIKQLFSHLGLNPSDYQEIRSAPASNATVTEAPRRWSLLQAINPGKPGNLTGADPGLSAATRIPPSADPLPMTVAAPLPPTLPVASAPASAPAATISSSPADGLRALFQSVREPVPPPLVVDAPAPVAAETPADLIYRDLRAGMQVLAAQRPPVPTEIAPVPPWASYDGDKETRYSPPPQAAAPPPVAPRPAPVATPAVAPAPAAPVAAPARVAVAARPSPAAVAASPEPARQGLQAAFRRLSEPEPPRSPASGRLRLNYGARSSAAAVGSKDERLGDVLKRISAQNPVLK